MTGEHVPVIDLGPWWGSAHDRLAVGRQVDAAARRFGFFQVVGHRVPQQRIDAMVEASSAFFELPVEVKHRCTPADPSINRGYAARGTEALSYSIGRDAPPDLFEAFNIGEDDVDYDDPFYAAERRGAFAPNIWPDEPALLRPAMVGYFDSARHLALTLTEVFAVALGLPEGWFSTYVDRSTTTMRAIRYERRAGEPDPLPGQQRMGAHTDYGIVTVLYAEAVAGLQIVAPSGEWIDVVPADGGMVINLGDLTAQWTNDQWRSTVHRVVPPSAQVGGPVVRRSAAFFLDGNWDAVITCLPTCTNADNPPRYSPVTAGQHLMAKLMGPRLLRASDAVDTSGDRGR
ncbi:MAG TPA: 2-oxoglutarate and iron-dependent oxygenase domain-containing protein [Ilumatobacteraceae bacterium]|nr:2-oxoglutarate and iron-dependent oxygenase domain-containing protein [Ilumatobacteraceae bacterium]